MAQSQGDEGGLRATQKTAQRAGRWAAQGSAAPGVAGWSFGPVVHDKKLWQSSGAIGNTPFYYEFRPDGCC